MNIETKKNIYIGMDLHKRTSTFCVKDKDGKVIDKRKLDTDREQVINYLAPYAGSTLTMEPVSQWYVYADLIQSLGIDVHLAHPMKVKAIAFARVKTDTIDAGVLADLLRANLLPEAYFSPKKVRCWKETVRFRSSLVSIQTDIKNKIHSILFKNALISPYANIWGKKGMLWLKEQNISEPFKLHVEQYLVLLADVGKRIGDSEKEIEKKAGEMKETNLLMTIPGISYFSALTIISEIGDIKRFTSAGKLMGYAGLTPSTYASGDKVRHGRITKQGSRWLRTVLVEVAWRQSRLKKKSDLKEFYTRLAEKKGAKTAAVATARKLCAIIWRILTDNRPFEAEYGKTRMLTNLISLPSQKDKR